MHFKSWDCSACTFLVRWFDNKIGMSKCSLAKILAQKCIMSGRVRCSRYFFILFFFSIPFLFLIQNRKSASYELPTIKTHHCYIDSNFHWHLNLNSNQFGIACNMRKISRFILSREVNRYNITFQRECGYTQGVQLTVHLGEAEVYY